MAGKFLFYVLYLIEIKENFLIKNVPKNAVKEGGCLYKPLPLPVICVKSQKLPWYKAKKRTAELFIRKRAEHDNTKFSINPRNQAL